MTSFTRRQLLGGVAVAGVGAVAGCSDGDAEPDGTRLVAASVQNQHDEPHVVDVIVEFDNAIEHWSTHELEDKTGNNNIELERNWPSEAGEFRVTARLDQDGDTVVERTPEDLENPDCANLQIEVNTDGVVNIFNDSTNCSPSSDGGDE